ncbi:MAG: methyltransferase family protein [Senegalia sp. (in: firmicutes)]|uniref:methyltransferase family protein n=1 Tax=Senegalia sp. (in: firmicutes) TaxID=1924098 RepID=UPI003F9613B5
MKLDIFDYIFIIISILWLLEFVIYPSRYKKDEIKKDTFYMILVTIILVAVMNGIMTYFDIGLFNIKWIRIIALFVYFFGLLLRYWSLFVLGRNFSRFVHAEEDQDLISKGPYRYLRHPLYLGLFLLTISIPLYTENFLVFIFSAFIMFKILKMRMDEEEKMMEKIIGPRYIKWKEKRYKFIPFIY